MGKINDEDDMDKSTLSSIESQISTFEVDNKTNNSKGSVDSQSDDSEDNVSNHTEPRKRADSSGSFHSVSSRTAHLKEQQQENEDTEPLSVETCVDQVKSDTEVVHIIEVPVFVSALVLFGYIFLGAVLFSEWEHREWDLLVGFYFSFITLSTIGFGDYVFGTGITPYGSQKSMKGLDDYKTYKLVVTGLYIVFGLAIMSMCINLIKHHIKRYISYVGERFGLCCKREEA